MNPTSSSAAAEFVPATQEELRRFLAENEAGPKRALAPVGGRTALDYGYPLSKPATTINLTGLGRVVDFPVRDMTITVEAGIRVDRLSEILAAQGQRLPVDIAQSNRATLGGAVATNASGPRRYGYGTLRDYVIGLTAVTAEGRLFHSGGRVVKNVAGYDLCKLLVGSLGTLAVLTQLTLKLKPVCENSLFIAAGFENPSHLDAAVEALMTSETRPAAIEAMNASGAAAIEAEARVGLPVGLHVLAVGFEGSARETEWQAETARRELSRACAKEVQEIGGNAAGRLWSALTEFPTAADEPLAFEADLIASRNAEFESRASRFGIALLSHAASGVVIGKFPDSVTGARQAADILSPLAAFAAEARGHLRVLHCDPPWKETLPIWGDLGKAASLMRKLKSAFDPEDLLNPGRLFPPS